MDGVQLSQGYGTTTRRQFTFYHLVLRNSWYSFNWPLKNERLGWPWSHPVVLNSGPLDWESSALSTRPPYMSIAFVLTFKTIVPKKFYEMFSYVSKFLYCKNYTIKKRILINKMPRRYFKIPINYII